MSKKYKVFYITTHMKNGDVWQTKRGTQEEAEELFRLHWADEECLKITFDERLEELKLTNPEHII